MKTNIDRKHNYVYKITVKSDPGKYYIGKHSTDYEEDCYRGSGREVRKIVEKYGKDDLNLEILSDWPTSLEAYQEEKRAVGDLWKTDPNCLNCNAGGHVMRDNTGLTIVNDGYRMRFVSPEAVGDFLAAGWKLGVTEAKRKQASEGSRGRVFSNAHKQKLRESNQGRTFVLFEGVFYKVKNEELNEWYSRGAVKKSPDCGRVLSEKTRQKISEKHKGRVTVHFLNGELRRIFLESFQELQKTHSFEKRKRAFWEVEKKL